jgi:thiamine-phosphate pyrophosphorylase
VSEVRRLAPRLELALSTHAVDELRDAAATDLFSFAVFGPVFATPSKRGLGAPQGLDGLAAACAATGARTAAAGPTPPSPTTLPALPVLALGGIDAHRAPACFAAGAAGIACIRAVLAASDPTAALAAFLIPPRPRT